MTVFKIAAINSTLALSMDALFNAAPSVQQMLPQFIALM